MSHLRELTDAELDVVGGGAEAVFGPEPAPMRGLGSNPVLVVLEDIIRLSKESEERLPRAQAGLA
jgi:hypothetical protein